MCQLSNIFCIFLNKEIYMSLDSLLNLLTKVYGFDPPILFSLYFLKIKIIQGDDRFLFNFSVFKSASILPYATYGVVTGMQICSFIFWAVEDMTLLTS